MTAPVLRTVDVADRVGSWSDAGFAISTRTAPSVDIGPVAIRLEQPVATTSWSFDGLAAGVTDIDGIATTPVGDDANAVDPGEQAHPNHSFHLDHVVMISPDLRRSIPALEANGFEVRRRRDIGKGREQVFLWTGPTIIELVGPTAPEVASDEPSDLWGLAISTSDIDLAAETLGDRLGRVKDAVQTGRRIATVRTADLAITPTIALMTPHG